MEYCALGDLSLFIKRRDTLRDHRYTRDMIAKYPNPRVGALNEVVVRHFLKQLSSALKFLRDRNLIHRDIKPQNLLLCPSPASYRTGTAQVVPFKGSDDSFTPLAGLDTLPMLKIADFGFARSLPSTSLAETLCGSPLYMAPEILRYEKYDAKADLWSVGTVLYEMVVGKPPFMASNHVELLRRIERHKDKIRFPDDLEISADIKSLIRGLLKLNPVERMTFADFFDNIVIQEDIPGLVGDDLAPPQRHSPADQQPESSLPNSINRIPDLPETRSPEDIRESAIIRYPHPNPSRQSSSPRVDSNTPPRTDALQRTPSGEILPRPGDAQRAAVVGRRPGPVSFATAPGRQEAVVDRNQAALERRPSRNSPLASPIVKQGEDRSIKDERERAAQDVAFERDYVVVEKRAVEVNAFADELANSPRIHAGSAPLGSRLSGGLVRRATVQNAPSANNVPASPKAIQVSGRARADSHTRQGSYERRYGQSPSSATSAISKALNMATDRLFGVGFSPPMGISKGGRSPPLPHNPYPAYPAAQYSLLMSGEGAKTNAASDEDTKTVQYIEDCATRSDVVYGFAEVKYKQLIPLTPSVQADLDKAGDQIFFDSDDGELTPDAVVTLSEEALVLYVKALALLAKSMDIAGAWWARKNRGEVFGDVTQGTTTTNALVGTRINNVVQWVRNRFNEVLEKAEFVRLKLIEGQRRLPPDHPNHPSNHSVDSASAGTLGTSADHVVVSSGVTAEKLMYDRALEMSRAAAINELTGEDLQGCEIAYITAIRMLEAVLENDELSQSNKSGDRAVDPEKMILDGVQVEDRKVVNKRE